MRAWIALMRVDIALRRTGFWPLVTRLDSLETRPAGDMRPRDIRRARRLGRAVRRAARLSPPHVQCLHRSLVLHQWLRTAGLPSELCVGVLKDAGELKAHAWVELSGQVVNDHPAAIGSFAPLIRHGAGDLLALPTIRLDARKVRWL